MLITGTPASPYHDLGYKEGGKRIDWFDVEPLKDAHPPRAVVYDAASIISSGLSQVHPLVLHRLGNSMTDKNYQALEDRINDLECQLAFQEQTVSELNDALSSQQLLITKMQDQMKYVAGKVKNMDSSNLARSLRRDTTTALLVKIWNINRPANSLSLPGFLVPHLRKNVSDHNTRNH